MGLIKQKSFEIQKRHVEGANPIYENRSAMQRIKGHGKE